MASIFISYRREDSAGYAGRICDALTARFGKDEVFMDVDDIKAGEDFFQVIQETESRCSVLLAIIGKSWLSPRLADPRDFVRAEIAAGLRGGPHGKPRVIPVLVGGASMPRAEDLPEDLAGLSRIEALSIEDTHFHQDIAQLVDAVKPKSTSFPLRGLLIAAVLLLVAVLVPLGNRWRAAAPAKIDGAWQASVKYSWGDTHGERFRFETAGHALTGTASYLGAGRGDRGILDGKIDGNRITFTTKSYATLDDKTYEEKHFYSGLLSGNEIHFSLQTDSGYDSRVPEQFTATRVVEPKR
jgi:TIR domain-containing protein